MVIAAVKFLFPPDQPGSLAFLLACVFLAGCANAPPVQEMSDARQAIAAAHTLPDDFAAVIASDLGRVRRTIEPYIDRSGTARGEPKCGPKCAPDASP